MTTLLRRGLALLFVILHSSFVIPASGQVPQIINYQGRVSVGSPPVNFHGSGQFKFALVNADASTSYWSNDGSSTAGSEPTAALTLTVTKGLYSVLLGDTTLGASMTAIPNSVFGNADVRLRVWFNDGTSGSQQLSPDQRITAVGYAMVAGALQAGTNINAGTVTATSFTGSGAGLTNLPVPTATNYLFAYNTTAQAAGLSFTFTNILFNNPAVHNDGWAYSAGSFNTPTTGLYLIRYDGQVGTSVSNRSATLRAAVNGVEIPGSQSAGPLTTVSATPISHSFITALSAGDALSFQLAADGSGVSLMTTLLGTTDRSFSCTIIRLQ